MYAPAVTLSAGGGNQNQWLLAAAQSSVVGYADSYSINGIAAADYNICVLYPGSTLVASSCTEDVSTTSPRWDGITASYGDCGTTLDLVNATSGRLLSPLVITASRGRARWWHPHAAVVLRPTWPAPSYQSLAPHLTRFCGRVAAW